MNIIQTSGKNSGENVGDVSMIIDQNNRKQLIYFLIHRWKLLYNFAAVERVYAASCRFAKANSLPAPQPSLCTIPYANRQIEILKQRIIEILPEVHFIDYSYEAMQVVNAEDEEVNIQSQYSVTNYPNPFSLSYARNPGITISYNIPISGNVNIEIYSLHNVTVSQSEFCKKRTRPNITDG